MFKSGEETKNFAGRMLVMLFATGLCYFATVLAAHTLDADR
jgi:hypothetical protein